MSIFSQVKIDKPSYNIFDLSHDKKMSLNMGELVPTMLIECIPGDVFTINTSQLLRFAPMIAPIMHQISVYHHFFYVPNRICWDNWDPFITGGEDGTNTSVFPKLDIELDVQGLGSLTDYLGLPVDPALPQNITASAIPFAAYQKIYNEYYRDQNLIPKVDDTLVDGFQTTNITDLITLRKRAWQHDYFTSALPWTQKGTEATIPLSAIQQVNFIDPTHMFGAGPAFADIESQSTGAASNSADIIAYTGAGAGANPAGTWQLAEFQTDATSINDLRNAFRLQEWLEKNARGGSRYNESIMVHFGVKTSDARLQRPEYIGGSSAPVTISEVLQTSDPAAGTTPQGNMAGHGITVGGSGKIRKFCEDHGHIIGIMSVMPKTAYQQGIHKQWTKFDKFDYYWPTYAHLGEQPILNKELYYTETVADDEVFGYTPRYSEYKYMNSTVHGEFKTTLDIWHMGRKFTTAPALNETFISCVPTDRIFAVTGAEKLYAHVHHRIKAKRKMPFFGTPRM